MCPVNTGAGVTKKIDSVLWHRPPPPPLPPPHAYFFSHRENGPGVDRIPGLHTHTHTH